MSVQPAVQASVTGERRPVSALFADVVGSTALAEQMDPEDWTELMAEATGAMAEAVGRYEGNVTQVLGDGMLAIFGAPVAHEDDAERAVRAGLDMLEAIEQRSSQPVGPKRPQLQIRVAINSGLAIMSDSGPMGETLNIAARLQSVAKPGSLLITSETQRFVAPLFELEPLGALDLKGKQDPVEAYVVLGEKGVPGALRGLGGLSSPIVGRSAQLDELRRQLTMLRAGGGRTAMLLGEPGIGKSRLLAELRLEAQSGGQPVNWREARCVSYGRESAYALLVSVARACLGLAEEAEPEAQLAEVGERLAELGERLSSQSSSQSSSQAYPGGLSDTRLFVAHLLSLPLEAGDDQRLAQLAPESIQARYVTSLEAVIRGLAEEGPLVLAMEDVHWADSSSVAVLSRLLPLAVELPLMLVLTMRPERDAPGWQLVEGCRSTFGDALLELALQPLSSAESRALVSNLLTIESLPRETRSFILERAEGNPFFVEEIIRMLIERGWVERRDDRWVATSAIAEAEIPDNLRSLLLARIDRLPAETRSALRVASVVGREFSLPLIAGVLGNQRVGADLARAEAAGLITFARAEPEPTYRFRHVLIQEAAYESLLKADRRRLHLAVGQALEERHPDGREVIAALLGLHFERAGDSQRAAGYLEMAARHALERFAVREARELLERALALLPGDSDDERRRRIRLNVDRVHAGSTFIPYGLDLPSLARDEALARDLGDDRLLVAVLLAAAEHRRALGEKYHGSSELRAALDEATAIVDRLGDTALRGRVLAEVGESLYQVSQYVQAIDLLKVAVPLLEAAGLLVTASIKAGIQAISEGNLGRFEEARATLRKARELAEQSGDPNALLDVDLFAGMVEAERGNAEDALLLAQRGTVLADEVGNTACSLVGNYLVGEQNLRLGRIELALPALERSSELAAYCAAVAAANRTQASLSFLRASHGDPSGLQGLDAALEEARRVEDRIGQAKMLVQRAEARRASTKPDWPATFADYEAAIRLFEEMGARPSLARALRRYGEALERAGHHEQAELEQARAAALAQELQMSF